MLTKMGIGNILLIIVASCVALTGIGLLWEWISQEPSPHSNAASGSRILKYGSYVAAIVFSITYLLFTSTAQSVCPADKSAVEASFRQCSDLFDQYAASTSNIQLSDDYDYDHYAQITRSFVSSLEQIDIRQCPYEYQRTFVHLVGSAKAFGEVLDQHPHIRSDQEALVEGFVRGVGGDPTGGAVQIQSEWTNFQNEADSSWRNVVSAGNDLDAAAAQQGVKLNNQSSVK